MSKNIHRLLEGMGLSSAEKKKTVRGVLCTLAGGIGWGFSGSCSQFLFSRYGAEPVWLTGVRMAGAGIVLVCFGLISAPERMRGIWISPKDALHQIVFSFFGILFCQLSYLTAIQYSNAATATVLQYLAPLLIMLYVCVFSRRLPRLGEIPAILLAMGGVFLLATGGNPSAMRISTAGLIWGLLAALSSACYSLIPRRLIACHGSIPVTAYGMLIGGVALVFGGRLWNATPQLDAAGIAAVIAIVLLGTVAGFTLYLQGVKDIGPVRASLLGCVEPLTAAVLAVFWLGTSFSLTDALGFICVMATVTILAREE